MNLKTFASVQAALQTLDSFDSAPAFDLWVNPVLDQLKKLSLACSDHMDLHDAALEEINPNVIHVPDGAGLENAGIGINGHLWVQSRLYMLNGFDGSDDYTDAMCGLIVDRLDQSCDATVFYGVDWTNTQTTFERLLFCDLQDREPIVPNDPSNWRFCITQRILRRSIRSTPGDE